MIFGRSDIYFRSDDTHRFLPGLIGVMVCLAALLLCLGISVNGWMVSKSGGYSQSFTVNIPASTPDLAAKTERIRDAISRLPQVTTVAALSNSQIKDLLKPWLGNDDGLDNLPFPTVLEVRLQNAEAAKQLNYTYIEKNLAAIAPGTEVDAHERWVAAFSNFSAAVQILIIMLAFLILASITTMIMFCARASLKLHARSVQLLHAIGAEDGYIARQFQQEVFMLVLPGAICGCFTAGILYWGMGFYLSSMPMSLMPSLAMRDSHLALLIIMPLACALAAWAVTRWSIVRQLQRVL